MTGVTRTGVVCLGLAVLDVVQRVERPPAWGTKGVATSVEVAAGGPATNAAIACAATGVPTTLVTALGGSPQARLVRAECERFGVRVVDLAATSAAETPTSEHVGSGLGQPDGSTGEAAGWELPVASCIVDAAGERTVVSTGALATRLSLTAEAESALAGARVLLLDGHHPAAAVQALRLIGSDPSCVSVLDAGSAKPHAEHWLANLDVVAGSADYAAGLTTLTAPVTGECSTDAKSTHRRVEHSATGSRTGSLAAAVAHVLAAGAGAAVMTDGAAPVVWQTRPGEAGSYAPPAVRVVDTLGAGDAWHGAFVAALASRLSLPEAVAYASEAATIRVQHQGARAWLAHLPPLTA